MNAPIAPDAIQTSAIALADIVPSRTHIQEMRRSRFDQTKLQELADSIRNLGVVQAVVVRPDPQKAAAYELVAGERRLLATKLAGLSTIPATIRDFTDEQVLEVQLVENLQRSDLHELEEAEGYDELMKLKKISADDVAGMVGKSRAYVYARLKLLALDLDGRQAFYAGDLDSSRALYVARITNPKLKAKALGLATMKRYNGTWQYSARDLRKELTGGEFSVDLRAAPFNQQDASFFEEVKIAKGKSEHRPLPDCIGCPNRTGNCIDLFTQDDDPEICTEPACYKIKVRQHSERLREVAAADGATIITGEEAKKIAPRKNELNGYVDLDALCEDDEPPEEKEPEYPKDEDDPVAIAAYEKAMDEFEARQEAYKPRTFRQILEGQAVSTVLIEDPKDKRIRTLVPLKEAKTALKKQGIEIASYRFQAQPRQSPFMQTRQSDEDIKAEREEKAAREESEMAFRKAVLDAVFAKWSGPLKREDLVEIADGILEGHGVREALKPLYGGKTPEPGQMKDAELARLIGVGQAATCFGWIGHSPKPLLDLAKRLKIDPDKIKKDLKAAAKAADKPAKAPAAKKAKK